MKQMFQRFISAVRAPSVLRSIAYGVPLLGLAFVLYLNYLPFGYDKTFSLAAGSFDDQAGEFRLSSYGGGLSPRMLTASGTPYRTLLGSTYAIYKPHAYLRDAIATVTVDTPGVTLIPPNIAFDKSAHTWAYVMPAPAASSSCTARFYGASEQDLAGTAELSNDPEQPFSVYAEWTPESGKDGFQQIVGAAGWQLLQNKEDVKFQVGSTTIKQPFDDSAFFDMPHTALAVYVPATSTNPNGHLDLFVDGNFSGRVYFQRAANLAPITPQDLVLGKSDADEASYFIGCVQDVRVAREGIDMATEGTTTFAVTRDKNEYPVTLLSIGHTVSLRDIKIHVVQH